MFYLKLVCKPLLNNLHKEIAHVTNNALTQGEKYTRLAKWKVLICPCRKS